MSLSRSLRMMDHQKEQKCIAGVDLAAYMYGELADGVADSIERHMAQCEACADDFAGIAFARYSVYEWNREEFAHLPTPDVSIDYSSNLGWLAALKGLFAPAPGFALGAAGALLLAAFLGAVYFLPVDTESDLVSSTAVPVVIEAPVDTTDNEPAVVVTMPLKTAEEESGLSEIPSSAAPAKPVRARYSKPKRTPI